MKRLLLLVVPLALLAGCSSVGAGEDVVVSVNGEDIVTQDELQTQLEEIADDDDFLTAVDGRGSGIDGTLSTGFVASVLSNHVLDELLRQDLADRGIEVSDDDRTQGQQELTDALGGDVEAAPPAYRELLLDLFGRVAALRRGLHRSGETLQTEVDAIFEAADVEVDPRYGSWDQDLHKVVPPEGPVAPTTAPPPTTAPAGG